MSNQPSQNGGLQDNSLVKLVILDPSDRSREILRNQVLGISKLWLESECTKYEVLGGVLASQSAPDIVSVALDANLEKALEAISLVAQKYPQTAVLAVSIQQDGQAVLRALRAGAREFLTIPSSEEELMEVLGRLLKSHSPGISTLPGRPKKSMTISIIGSRGGVGCTGIAVNLGATLAIDPENRVVLADLDLVLGDADVALDLKADYTIGDLAANVDKLDLTFLNRSLSKHGTGLYLLPHPVNVGEATQIEEIHLERILALLRASHTHLILDLSKGFRPTDLAALHASDVILVVVQLELSSLHNAVRLLAALHADPVLGTRIKVILNRVGMITDITQAKAVQLIGEFSWEIPNDHKTLMDSRNKGIPLCSLAPDSKVQQSFKGLAQMITGKTPDKPAAKSFWQSLFSKA
ncbi:MAG: response regulator [Gemmataceae bacterium]|nr:response regulator [Gemmataceae bacterium]